MASLAFTHQLGIHSNVVDSQNPENDPAYIASSTIISEVTEDIATVTTVKNFLTYILDISDQTGFINNAVYLATPTTIQLTNEIEGGLNENASAKRVAYYKIHLTSNNSIEQYAFYMNMLENTQANNYKDVNIKIYDASGTEIKEFKSTALDEPNSHMYEQFEVPADGDYYIRIYRELGYSAKYAFSIHPSTANGLVHDDEGELNDFASMATPLTLAQAQKDVNGTLNMTRKLESSIKGTDQHDFYEIDFDKTGTFALYANLYAGTKNVQNTNVYIKLTDASGVLIKKFSTSAFDEVGDNINEEFKIDSTGKYYLHIYRQKTNVSTVSTYATKYGFNITQP
jgi:hypothetical protein